MVWVLAEVWAERREQVLKEKIGVGDSCEVWETVKVMEMLKMDFKKYC